jgi:hypothetical protein
MNGAPDLLWMVWENNSKGNRKNKSKGNNGGFALG